MGAGQEQWQFMESLSVLVFEPMYCHSLLIIGASVSVTWCVHIRVCRLSVRPLAGSYAYQRTTCETWRTASGVEKSSGWHSCGRALSSSDSSTKRHSLVHLLGPTAVRGSNSRGRG